MGSAKRAVKVLDFDLHGSPYTHTKANVALNTIFLVLSIEQNGPPFGTKRKTFSKTFMLVYSLSHSVLIFRCIVGSPTSKTDFSCYHSVMA